MKANLTILKSEIGLNVNIWKKIKYFDVLINVCIFFYIITKDFVQYKTESVLPIF